VGIFDTYLAGRISAGATSAIGLSAYVGWLASMIVMLVGTGTTAIVSRQEGGSDRAEANHTANQSLTLSAILGVLIFAAMYALAPWFSVYCRMTGETYNITVHYLRIDAVGLALMSVTLVGSAALRGVGNMRTPMVIFALMNVVNIVASFALVFGVGPIPALGVDGIVGGTLVARVFGLLLLLIVFAQGRWGLRLIARELPISWARAARILRIGLPAAADGAVMWAGQFLFLAIIGSLGTGEQRDVFFAAHIVAVRVEAFTYLPAVAWGTATATMIGQALGAMDPKRAMRAGHEGVFQCGLLSLVISALFFFGASSIYRMMSGDPRVWSVGVSPFRIVALFQPLMVISIVYIGALRGAGDTRYPLLISFVGSILIRVPLGYLCGIVLDGGFLGAWIGMFGDMIWRAAAAAMRYFGGKWLKTSV